MLLLRAGDILTENAAHRLAGVFAADDPTGKLEAVWKVKEQLRTLLRTNSLADAADAKEDLKVLIQAAGRPETTKLYRTVSRWWKKIEVLVVTGATSGKFYANNTGIEHVKRAARGYRNPGNYKSVILMRSASGRRHDTYRGIQFPINREGRLRSQWELSDLVSVDVTAEVRRL